MKDRLALGAETSCEHVPAESFTLNPPLLEVVTTATGELVARLVAPRGQGGEVDRGPSLRSIPLPAGMPAVSPRRSGEDDLRYPVG